MSQFCSITFFVVPTPSKEHGGFSLDYLLAAASDAIVIGFHVKPNEKAEALLEKEKVDVRYYNIIFEVVEDIKKAAESATGQSR